MDEKELVKDLKILRAKKPTAYRHIVGMVKILLTYISK